MPTCRQNIEAWVEKGVQPEDRTPTKDGMWIGDKIYTPYNAMILTRSHHFI